MSHTRSITKPGPGKNAHIYFSPRHETHYAFTNGSGHPIDYQGRLYLTAEHLYQAMKFLNHQPAIAELVRTATDPRRVASQYQDDVRPDWPQSHLFVLEQVLTLKFHQYPGLKNNLIATGEAQLIQLGTDQYWCRAENGTGRNEFGRVLMKVRETFTRSS